jgi:XTP/dITP diphosphohydrolase
MASDPDSSQSSAPRPTHLYLATTNAHKVSEFQALADAMGGELQMSAASSMPAVPEDTGTFIGNARQKARALQSLLPKTAWVLADDSGVCVDALGGAPGVESAYFAGPQHDSAANLNKLTAVMQAVPLGQRGASFRCVLVLLGPDGREYVAEGRCEGTLRLTPVGGYGFGYDPLFEPIGYTSTYAELDQPTKNKISHRGRAWAKLLTQLRSS